MHAPLPRILAGGRPSTDRGCAGCAQLGLLRALRRAGLGVQGGLGCDRDAPAAAPASGRFALVAGLARLARGGRPVLEEAAALGARLLVVADRAPAEAPRAAAALQAAGARVFTVNPAHLGEVEAAARAAAERGGAALLALAACPRGTRPGPALSIAPARCNRCGACLALGCPAIADDGGEAMSIDSAVCTGCGLCAPLCRARAIGALAPGPR